MSELALTPVDMRDPAFRHDPHPLLRELRESTPVARNAGALARRARQLAGPAPRGRERRAAQQPTQPRDLALAWLRADTPVPGRQQDGPLGLLADGRFGQAFGVRDWMTRLQPTPLAARRGITGSQDHRRQQR
jgi:hypothetical protein